MALGGRALRLASGARAAGAGVGAVGVPAWLFARAFAHGQVALVVLRCLAMSFLSRFSWCLPAVGPSLLYGPLALLFAWGAAPAAASAWLGALPLGVPAATVAAVASLGSPSPGSVVSGLLALLFASIVVREWGHAAYIRQLVARRPAAVR